MSHGRLLLTPAEALFRIYAPKCRPNVPRRTVTRRSTAAPNSNAYSAAQNFSRSPTKLESMPRLPDDPMSKKLAAYKLDNDIEAEFVQMRQEDGKLSPAKRLRVLLSEIGDEEVVQELSPQGQFPNTAVVRVVQREELLLDVAKKEQALKALQKHTKQSKPKQIELNWAISENDLMMKLNQMAEFLDKGKKVELLLAAKKRQRRASPEEAEAVLSRLRDKIEEVGAKEVKEMEGKLLGQALLTVQKTK